MSCDVHGDIYITWLWQGSHVSYIRCEIHANKYENRTVFPCYLENFVFYTLMYQVWKKGWKLLKNMKNLEFRRQNLEFSNGSNLFLEKNPSHLHDSSPKWWYNLPFSLEKCHFNMEKALNFVSFKMFLQF